MFVVSLRGWDVKISNAIKEGIHHSPVIHIDEPKPFMMDRKKNPV